MMLVTIPGRNMVAELAALAEMALAAYDDGYNLCPPREPAENKCVYWGAYSAGNKQRVTDSGLFGQEGRMSDG